MNIIYKARFFFQTCDQCVHFHVTVSSRSNLIQKQGHFNVSVSQDKKQPVTLLSNSEGFQFPFMQTFAPSIFQFCNANIQGEVKYNVGFAMCIQKTCMHFARSSWNLTLGQQACLNVALTISGAYQKKVNESEVFITRHNWYMSKTSKRKKKNEDG